MEVLSCLWLSSLVLARELSSTMEDLSTPMQVLRGQRRSSSLSPANSFQRLSRSFPISSASSFQRLSRPFLTSAVESQANLHQLEALYFMMCVEVVSSSCAEIFIRSLSPPGTLLQLAKRLQGPDCFLVFLRGPFYYFQGLVCNTISFLGPLCNS